MSIADQLQALCDARTALVAKCNLMGAPVSLDATLRVCEQALCQIAGITSYGPGTTQTIELGYLRTDLIRVARALGFTVPNEATIPDVVEILQPSEVETTAYAVAIPAEDEGMYELHFFRAINTPLVGDTYGGKTIAYVYSGFDNVAPTSGRDIPWVYRASQFSEVHFDGPVEPLSCFFWFKGFANCTTFDLRFLNTQRCISFRSMFSGCSGISHLDLDGFDTRNVQTFSDMFVDCTELTSLNVQGWNARKVVSMDYMFSGCTKLTELDLSTWKFGTGLENVKSCFKNCTGLNTIFTAPSCDLSFVSNSDLMFGDAYQIVGGNGTLYTALYENSSYARVDKAGQPGYFTAYRDMVGDAFAVVTSGGQLVFARGQKPQTGERYKGAMVVASYDFDETAEFTNPGDVPWHDYDHGILSVRFDGWIKPQSCKMLFTYLMDCESFDLACLWCGDDPDFTHMFYACYALTELDLSPLCDTTPTSIDAMFAYCDLLQTIYVKPGTDWSSAYDNNYAFRFCYSLVGGAGTVYDWENVGSDRAIIDGAGGMPGYFTAKP